MQSKNSVSLSISAHGPQGPIHTKQKWMRKRKRSNDKQKKDQRIKVHSHERQRLRVRLRQIVTLHLRDASNAKNGYRTYFLCLTQHPHRHNVSNLTQMQTHTETLMFV